VGCKPGCVGNSAVGRGENKVGDVGSAGEPARNAGGALDAAEAVFADGPPVVSRGATRVRQRDSMCGQVWSSQPCLPTGDSARGLNDAGCSGSGSTLGAGAGSGAAATSRFGSGAGVAAIWFAAIGF
jgi:hypothetical protein